MNAALLILLLGASVATASFSNSTIYTVELGTQINHVHAPVPCTNDPTCRDTQYYYRVWIPSNANSLHIEFTNTNDSYCYPLLLGLRSHGFAAPVSVSGTPYFAGVTTYVTSISSYVTIDVEPGYVGSTAVDFTPGDWLYFEVSMYYTSDVQYYCTYSILVTATYCSNDTVAVKYPTTVADTCQNYTTVASSSSPINLYSQVASFLKVSLPSTTSDVVIQFNSSSEYLRVITQSYSTPTSSSYHFRSSVNGELNANVTGYWYSFSAPTPRGGDYWIVLYDNYDTIFDVTVNVIVNSCNGSAGYLCASRLAAFNPDLPQSIPNQLLLPNEYFYWYLDIAPYTQRTIDSTIYVSGEYASADYFVRYNGFPFEDSDSGYETNYQYIRVSETGTWILLPEDTYTGGRYYFGVYNYGNYNFTLSFASPTTSGTSGSTTGFQTSGVTGITASGVTAGVTIGVTGSTVGLTGVTTATGSATTATGRATSGATSGVTGPATTATGPATTATGRATSGATVGLTTATGSLNGTTGSLNGTTGAVFGTTGSDTTGSSSIVVPSMLLFIASLFVVLAM